MIAPYFIEKHLIKNIHNSRYDITYFVFVMWVWVGGIHILGRVDSVRRMRLSDDRPVETNGLVVDRSKVTLYCS